MRYLLIILSILTLTLCSCDKYYSCDCGTDQNVVQENIVVTALTARKAEENCNKIEYQDPNDSTQVLQCTLKD